MARQRSAFDIIGPVMIGPSSSHTAGAVRLGALARAVFGARPQSVNIALHGSFATTGPGHGTDLALVAGLLGMRPDNPSIPEAFTLARQQGMKVTFSEVDLGDAHPNTALFQLEGADGERMEIRGSSLGGGDVVVARIDDFEVEATGELPLLVVSHHDQPGEIASVTGLLAEGGVNVASMQVSRERKGANALMLISTDVEVDQAIADKIAEQPGVNGVRRVPAV